MGDREGRERKGMEQKGREHKGMEEGRKGGSLKWQTDGSRRDGTGRGGETNKHIHSNNFQNNLTLYQNLILSTEINHEAMSHA